MLQQADGDAPDCVAVLVDQNFGRAVCCCQAKSLASCRTPPEKNCRAENLGKLRPRLQ